jgi:mono/diheme cytochrome c family protein
VRLPTGMPRWRSALLVFTVVAVLSSCDDMSQQPKQAHYRPEASPASLPDGVVRYGAERVQAPPVTLALLERGQQRFRIYCTPCHSELGDGRGMIVQRGFPPPPSYHIDRLREAPVQHFYDVITHGYGAMYPFADRVQPRDRWAIAAYIRALQRSQSASMDDVPAAERGALQ